MNLKITLIRHGKTQGNLERKYVGQTDDPVCELGMKELNKYVSQDKYKETELLFSSPLKRCLQTSSVIYKNIKPIICNDLMECDFGEFQGMGYKDLKDNEIYKTWLENGDEITFPKGENSKVFKKRCKDAFKSVLLQTIETNKENITIVCHGGTIRSILEGYTDKSFYNWIVDNGNGFVFEFDTDSEQLTNIKPLWDVE